MQPLQPERVQFDTTPRQTRAIQPIITTAVGASDTTIYTAGDRYDFLIHSLWATNITAADERLTLYLKPSGVATADGNAMLKGYCVGGNSIAVLCGPGQLSILLQPGMALVAKVAGTASSVNIGGFGADVLDGAV